MAAPHPDFLKLADDAKKRIQQLPPAQVSTMVERGAVLLDVREKEEFAQAHLPQAKHLSRGLLEMNIGEVAPDKDAPIVCYCSGGNRGALAADTLQKMGYRNVWSIEGGMNACTAKPA